MTTTALKAPEFTDTMYRVEDLAAELEFWLGSMGYEMLHQVEGRFAMLRDPGTGQRLTLSNFQDLETPYSLMAMKADDLEDGIVALRARGPIDVKHRSELGDWALLCLRDTYPVLLWTETD